MVSSGHQSVEAPAQGGIATVQALRAAACLLVVAYHGIDSWGASRQPTVSADRIWPNGAAGVDLFFVISGFVMAVSSSRLAGAGGAARFVGRRLRRVVPLYWIMTCAKLAVLLALAGQAGSLPTIWHAAASFLFIPSRDAAGVVRPVLGVGWTLQFEMLFYALFAAALVVRGRRPDVPALWLVAPVLVPLAVAGLFRQADWPTPFALANGLVLEFCLGLAVAGWCGARPPPRPGVALGLFALGVVCLLTSPQPGPWRFVVWGLPAATILAASVWLEPVLGRRLPAWLLAIGEASYAIYLLHPFLVPVVARFVIHLVTPSLALPTLLAASLAASAAGGLALHRWVDQKLQQALSSGGPRGWRRMSGPAETLAKLVQT